MDGRFRDFGDGVIQIGFCAFLFTGGARFPGMVRITENLGFPAFFFVEFCEICRVTVHEDALYPDGRWGSADRRELTVGDCLISAGF